MNEYKVKFQGLTATLYGNDPTERIESFWAKGRFYEAGQNELLSIIYDMRVQIKEHGGCIADVGANKGNHAVFFTDICLFRNVFAYEASRYIFSILSINGKKYGLTTELFPINRAILAEASHFDFVPSDFPKEKGGHGMGRAVPSPNEKMWQQKGTTINQEFKSDRLSYVKLDIEGGEADAIRGGLNVIGRDKPLISAECHTQAQAHEIFAMLQPLGYRLLARVNYQQNTYVWSAW